GRAYSRPGFAISDAVLGNRAVCPGGAFTAQSISGGGGRPVHCVGRVWRAVGSVSARGTHSARQSERRDCRDDLRLRRRAIYLAGDARALDVVRRHWHRSHLHRRLPREFHVPESLTREGSVSGKRSFFAYTHRQCHRFTSVLPHAPNSRAISASATPERW